MDLFKQLTDKKSLFAILALLMVVSRPYPLSGIVHLADASNAVFFLGGLMLLPSRAFVAYLALAVTLDFVSIRFFGTSDFCVSPAYGFQLPAFALLWFGGRLLAGPVGSLVRAAAVIAQFVLLQVIAHVITSGSFYLLSGRFTDPDVAGFIERTELYLPGYVIGSLWYVGLFVGLQYALHWASDKPFRVRS